MSTQIERDRPAPEAEIEVTEEMIEAGVDAYHGYYADLQPSSLVEEGQANIERKMIKEVFIAMTRKEVGT